MFLGRLFCVTAGAFALLMLVPAFTRHFWLARLVASELSFLLAGLPALLGLVVLGAIPRQSTFRIFGGMALLSSLLPFAATVQTYTEHDRAFSAREYVAWGPRRSLVERRSDLMLEPSRPDLLLDFYRGQGAGPRPLLVIVHGGSFSGGNKGENRTVTELFAMAGYSVADVQYRLAPKAPFPAAVRDVKCLAGRLRERGREFGVDPERVAYLGRSAGAAIGVVAAYSAGDSRIPPACDVLDRPVAAMVSLYGPMDLDWGWRVRSFPDPITGFRVLERYIGGTPLTNPSGFRLASATSWVSASTPSTLLIHGTRDTLVSPHHMVLLAEAFARKGLPPPRSLLIPFAEHGFDYRPGGLGEQLARAETLEFLANVSGNVQR